ncbi:hypothetical protein TNCV_1725711 [Trichonephila clavipes]|nr:hypothetical protein TNCV_1725711 [Trichonephila clavipes]
MFEKGWSDESQSHSALGSNRCVNRTILASSEEVQAITAPKLTSRASTLSRLISGVAGSINVELLSLGTHSLKRIGYENALSRNIQNGRDHSRLRNSQNYFSSLPRRRGPLGFIRRPLD